MQPEWTFFLNKKISRLLHLETENSNFKIVCLTQNIDIQRLLGVWEQNLNNQIVGVENFL